MQYIGNVLAVEPDLPIRAHVHRYLGYRFEGHAVADLMAHDDDEVRWTAAMRAPDGRNFAVVIHADLIEDDQFLAFDIASGI